MANVEVSTSYAHKAVSGSTASLPAPIDNREEAVTACVYHS
ncbi:hypothetical protein [Bacillus benzoevorans]|uniref:Uncharacterized protein n=1 Tax=Bacillus benzoevorans TaxID=1456 RepID=A0A7X0HNL2_9BACI|nr:hypothetical protein [Bacillus benzoevorans]